MGEADRKESVAFMQRLKQFFRNDHLVPRMHAILATSTSDEQKFLNAKRISDDLSLVHPDLAKDVYAKTQPIIESLFDAHNHRTKNIIDDPLFYQIPENEVRADPINAARNTATDAAAKAVEVGAKSAVGSGVLATGALLASKVAGGAITDAASFFSLPGTKPDSMKPIPTKMMKKFIKRMENGGDLDRMIDVYRSKTSKNPSDYTDGMHQITKNDLYRSRLQPDTLKRAN